jgi:hypothetical protein
MSSLQQLGGDTPPLELLSVLRLVEVDRVVVGAALRDGDLLLFVKLQLC